MVKVEIDITSVGEKHLRVLCTLTPSEDVAQHERACALELVKAVETRMKELLRNVQDNTKGESL